MSVLPWKYCYITFNSFKYLKSSLITVVGNLVIDYFSRLARIFFVLNSPEIVECQQEAKTQSFRANCCCFLGLERGFFWVINPLMLEVRRNRGKEKKNESSHKIAVLPFSCQTHFTPRNLWKAANLSREWMMTRLRRPSTNHRTLRPADCPPPNNPASFRLPSPLRISARLPGSIGSTPLQNPQPAACLFYPATSAATSSSSGPEQTTEDGMGGWREVEGGSDNLQAPRSFPRGKIETKWDQTEGGPVQLD